MEGYYKNPELPGSFGGVGKLVKEYNRTGNKVKYEDARRALTSVDSYSIYKQAKQKFRTRPVVTYGIDHIWDMDLLSIPRDIVQDNDGYSYILGCLDIFTRHVWCTPLLSKRAPIVLKGFKDILASTDRSPHILRSDEGSEFKNRIFIAYLKEKGINLIHNEMKTKANYIERFWRTLRVKIHRYMHENNTNRFIDKLQDFVKAYNNTYHRGIKARPSEITFKNELKFYKAQKDRSDKYVNDNIKYKFSIGDKVRISHLSHPFKRSFDQQHTPEIFTVFKRSKRQGLPIYEVKDCSDSPIKGKLYQEELTLVDLPDDVSWPIDRVFRNKKRKIDGVVHYLVKWRNYPDACNSYVPAADLTDI